MKANEIKTDVPNHIRPNIEVALALLSGVCEALDVMDIDAAWDMVSDAGDVLCDIIGDYDIEITKKHHAIIESARRSVEESRQE